MPDFAPPSYHGPWSPTPSPTDATPPAPAPAAPASTGRPRASGVSIAALVVAVAALVGVVVMVTMLASGTAPGGGEASSWGGEHPLLTGLVEPDDADGSASGDSLALVMHDVIAGNGGDPTGITCPRTKTVAPGIVTACRGTVDGDEWGLVAYFVDTEGNFILGLV